MYYQSTRSSHTANSLEAVIRGIAPDGGLYVDPNITARSFDWRHCLTLDEFGMAEMLLSHLLPDFEDMSALVERAYRGRFENERLSPLVRAGDAWVLELFRGPTSAFKDVALSMLPQLITKAREQLGITERIVILTATSGDTGKAALEGFHDVPGTGIAVFYPDGGVSAVQRAQMVTQRGDNVHVTAVRGNFDDCQRGVKEAFRDVDAAEYGMRLSSANSINIGRLAPQVMYYFRAYADLVKAGRIRVGDTVHYVVPTGNFGDILAGYFAKLMGLPVGKLVCASNANDVLTEFLSTGVYDKRRPFHKTTSPSMDILVSSNLERMLYLLSDGDDAYVAGLMRQLRDEGRYQVTDKMLARLHEIFSCACCDDAQAAEVMGRVWREHGYVCDPHTAVAWHAADAFMEQADGAPVVVLSTASPYKFPAAVLSALGGIFVQGVSAGTLRVGFGAFLCILSVYQFYTGIAAALRQRKRG